MSRFDDIPAGANRLGYAVVGIAIETHRAVGPGLLERVYQIELRERLRGQGYDAEMEVPIFYRDNEGIEHLAYRADLIVDSTVAIELKSAAAIDLRNILQLKSYLRLAQIPLGYVLNFGPPRLEIKRVVPTLSPFSAFRPFRDFGRTQGEDEAP